jgi:hypothetical protein
VRRILVSYCRYSQRESSYPPAPATPTKTPTAVHIATSPAALENPAPHIIDVDAIEDGVPDGIDQRRRSHGLQKQRPQKKRPCKARCEGFPVVFPDGKNEHTSYPFGMHSERSMPWNYRSIDDAFYIQAKSCQKWSPEAGRPCEDCEKLTSSTLYTGIMDRIKYGSHENIPLVYHGVGGLMTIVRRKTDTVAQLRMSKLNDSRKLLVKAGALEDHKQLVLAIASGRVERVAPLVQAALKNGAGIGAIIQQYERATEKLYKPKGYTNEDIMRSIVLLRLGGARVAEFAHRSLALPSLTTIRRNTILPTLVVSPSAPSLADVESNISACYSAFDSVGTPVCDSRPPSDTIIHQVLMLDELAVEKRARWDDTCNRFQGTCREHNHRIPLDFTSERELELLCDAIENDDVHLATEVCGSL